MVGSVTAGRAGEFSEVIKAELVNESDPNNRQ